MLRQTFETTPRRRCATQIGTCWTIQELPICVGKCDRCVHVPYIYIYILYIYIYLQDMIVETCVLFYGCFSAKSFTVGVLTATLDLAALVLVGVAAFFGSEVVLAPFM